MQSLLHRDHSFDQRFQDILNQAPFSAALLTGSNFIIELANEISLNLWGKDANIIGRPLLDVMPEMKDQAVYKALVEVYNTGIAYEGKEQVVYLKKDGVVRKVYVNFTYKAIFDHVGHVASVFAVGYDVTGQVEAHAKIAEAEERVRLAVEGSGIGTFDLDYQTGVLITSPNLDSIFGFDHPRPYRDYVDAIHPEDLPIRNESHVRTRETGLMDHQIRIIRPDGSVRWVQFKGKVLYDTGHVPVRLLGTVLDVTDQHMMITRLAESEQRFRTLITETPEVATGLYLGKELRIQYVNNVMLRFWDKDQTVIGKTLREAMPELNGQPFSDQLDRVYETGETYTGREVEARLMDHGELSTFYFNYTYKALRNSQGEIYAIHHMAVDVTEQVKTKQRYIESENRFRNLLMQAPFGICILKGNTFSVDFANDIFLQLVDRKRDEYIGRPLWEGLPEMESQIFRRLLKEVMRTGNTFHGHEYEARILRSGQMENVYVDFTYDPIKNEQNKIDGILVLAIDVTEKVLGRKEIERSRDRFNSILEALPQMAWTASATGEIDYITERWYDYSGHTENSALGFGWLNALPPKDKEAFRSKWETSVRGDQLFEEEVRVRRHDGEYRWHLIRAVPITDDNGTVTLWVGTSTDIHDRKLFSEELERKISERTKELERSNSELEQFAYVSSHDLQEPLRKITTFTGLLKNSLGEISEKSQRYLDKISASSLRMLNLIQDVLEFSRLTQSERKYQRVDLDHVLQNVIRDFDLMIEQKQAAIETQPLGIIEAMPLQMNQLFHNLLSNSLKFIHPHRLPHICVRSRVLDAVEIKEYNDLEPLLSYLMIEWEDNGIGFSQEYAEQIFEIFQRLNERRAYSGTGIGLAMCRRIAGNHHGQIFARSRVDEGTTFYVILPLRQSLPGDSPGLSRSR